MFTYNANAAAATPNAGLQLALVNDGDAATAASVDTSFESGADLVEWLRQNAARIASSNLWTAFQPFNAGWGNSATPTNVYVIGEGNVGVARISGSSSGNGKIVRYVNAFWTDGTQKWNSNDHTVASTAIYQDLASVQLWEKDPTAATWNDGTGAGAWTLRHTFDLTAGDYTAGRNISAAVVQATNLLAATNQISSATGVASSAMPNSAVAIGDHWKDSGDFAWGRVIIGVAGAVTSQWTANVHDINHAAAGTYAITLMSAAGSGAKCVPRVTYVSTVGGGPLIATVDVGILSNAFTVNFWNLAGVLTDPPSTAGFTFAVKGS